MRPSRTARLLLLVGAAGLGGCSTLLGLDRFDGASLAIETEAGDTGDGATSDAPSMRDADAASDRADGRIPESDGDPDANDASRDANQERDAAAQDDAEASGGDALSDAGPAEAAGDAADASTPADDGPSGDARYTDEGDGATADAVAPPLFTYTFDTGTQGWSVMFGRLGDAGARDCSATHSSTEGDPTAGAVEIKAPFSDRDQLINVGLNYAGTLPNLTGRTYTVHIKLASGLSDSITPGSADLFVQDTNYTWADNGAVPLYPGGGWITLSMNLDHPGGTVSSGYSPSGIRVIGIQFANYGSQSPSPADIFIDTVVIQ